MYRYDMAILCVRHINNNDDDDDDDDDNDDDDDGWVSLSRTSILAV